MERKAEQGKRKRKREEVGSTQRSGEGALGFIRVWECQLRAPV